MKGRSEDFTGILRRRLLTEEVESSAKSLGWEIRSKAFIFP